MRGIDLRGNAGLADLDTEILEKPDTQEMMGRIAYAPYAKAEDDYTNVTTLIEVTKNDGTVVSDRADHARGSSAFPMDFDDVAKKFIGCANYRGFASHHADCIIGPVRDFEALETVGALSSALAG